MMMNLHSTSSNPASALLPTLAPQVQAASATAEPNPNQPSFARLLQHNQPPAQTTAPVPTKPPAETTRPEPAARHSAAQAHATNAAPARPIPAAREPARSRDAAARSTPPAHAAAKPATAATAATSTESKDDAAHQTARSDETDETSTRDPALADWLAGLNLPAPALPVADTSAADATGTDSAQPSDTAATAATEAAAAAAGSAALAALGASTAGAKTDGRSDPAQPGADRDRLIDTTLRGSPREGAETALPAAVTARDSHGGQPGSGDSSDPRGASPAWTPISAATPSTAAFMPIGLSTLVPPADARTASAAPVPLSLPMPITSPEFPQAMGTQLAVLAQGGIERAELHLNPAEMGPVSVQIAIEGTQARIDFGADMAATRQAIESSLPELASALREAGLTLTGGGVSQHSRGHHAMADAQAGRGSRGNGGDDGLAVTGDTPSPLRRSVRVGGVDMYA